MKKTIVLTSALAACLLFSGCSSEETVSKQQYDEVVTQNQDLEQQVSDLNAQIDEIKQQTLIPQLKEEAAAVTKAISSIGEVTLEKEKTISSVEQQYNALREDAKQYVTNYDILTTAKERISASCFANRCRKGAGIQILLHRRIQLYRVGTRSQYLCW